MTDSLTLLIFGLIFRLGVGSDCDKTERPPQDRGRSLLLIARSQWATPLASMQTLAFSLGLDHHNQGDPRKDRGIAPSCLRMASLMPKMHMGKRSANRGSC